MSATELKIGLAPYFLKDELVIDVMLGQDDAGFQKFTFNELVKEYLMFNTDDEGFIESEAVDETYVLIDALNDAITRLNDAIRD